MATKPRLFGSLDTLLGRCSHILLHVTFSDISGRCVRVDHCVCHTISKEAGHWSGKKPATGGFSQIEDTCWHRLPEVSLGFCPLKEKILDFSE